MSSSVPTHMIRRCPLLVLLLIMGSMQGFLPARVNAQVTVAIVPANTLDLPRSPVLDLLYNSLTGISGIALLERQEIDKILEEQALQLAWTAEGMDARRRIGQLLKADLVVLLEGSRKGSVRKLDVVVANTAMGLRLLKAQHAWDESDPEPLVEALVQDVRNAVTRNQQPLRQIVAVSPFLGQDQAKPPLNLERVYAEIVEQAVSQVEGVRTVEIAEGQALSKEISLAGADPVKRPHSPCYLIGNYKSQGKDKERRVELRVELKLGETLLGEKDSGLIDLGAAAEFLRKGALELLAASLNEPPAESDPISEAEQLANRSAEFTRVGETEEALNLIEAALLIMPDFKVFHGAAQKFCETLCADYLEGPRLTSDKMASAQRGLDFAMRSLDHFRIYIYNIHPLEVTRLQHEYSNQMWNTISRLGWSYSTDGIPLVLKERMQEFFNRRSEIEISYYENLHQRGLLFASLSPFFELRMDECMPLDIKIRALHLLNSYPRQFYELYSIINSVGEPSERSAEDHQFLEQAAKEEGENIRLAYEIWQLLHTDGTASDLVPKLTAAKEKMDKLGVSVTNLPSMLQKKINDLNGVPTPTPLPERERRARSRASVPFGPTPVPTHDPRTGPRPAEIFLFNKEEPEVVFRPIFDPDEIPFPGHRAAFQTPPIEDWFRAGPDVDVIRMAGVLYIQRAKDEFAPVPLNLKEGEGIRQVLWDEKFAWILLNGTHPGVIALDPNTLEMVSFTREQGLEPMEGMASGMVLEKGRILMVGCEGKTWTGMLQYSGPGTMKVEILHEAKESTGPPEELNTTFQPGGFELIRSATAEGHPVTQVLITRKIKVPEGYTGGVPRLKVDINSKKISLGAPAPSPRTSFSGRSDEVEDGVRRMHEERWAQYELALRVEIDGKTYAFGREGVWLLPDPEKIQTRLRLKGVVPPGPRMGTSTNRRVFSTKHYGVLCLYENVLYQANLKKEGASGG
jgi:hypothetical protein